MLMADDKIEIIVEDSEEVPTSVQKKVKVLEMPVFTDADKKNIERMVDRLDKFISEVYSERVSINVLREQLGSLQEEIRALNAGGQPGAERLLVALRADVKNMEDAIGGLADRYAQNTDNERIVNFIDRAVRSIEALAQSLADMKIDMRDTFNERIGLMDNKIEEKLYALDSTISYMKGMIIDLSEKVSAGGVSDTKFSLFVENMNEKFDAYMASLNNRLDNLVLQVVEPSNDISARLDALKNVVEAVKKARASGKAPNLAGLRKDLEAIKKMKINAGGSGARNISALRNDIESLRRSVDSIRKMKPPKASTAMDRKLNAIIRDIEVLKSRRVRVPKIKVPRVRVQKLPTNAFEMLQQVRRNIRSKRVAKKRQPEKISLMRSVDSLQNRVLDLYIFSAISAERKTVTAMKESIPTSETKIRKRVNQLVVMGKLKRIKRGTRTVYSVV